MQVRDNQQCLFETGSNIPGDSIRDWKGRGIDSLSDHCESRVMGVKF